MKRKQFISTIGSICTGLSLKPVLNYSNLSNHIDAEGLPKYWVWIRPSLDKTDDDWKLEFEEWRSIGIEAILPQVYASNKSLFNIPNHEIEESWLERIIPIAHAAGLQVHAWMWTMICNNPRILKNNPEWYVVNRNGDSAATHPAYVDYYKFLCPRKPEVRAFVKERVKALASIPNLDGIHLDYVRMPDVILAEGLQPKYDIIQDQEYPEYDYCYCSTCRNAYLAKYDVDPMEIEDPANDKDWYQFRYDAVVDLVNDHLVPEAKSTNKWITAAVFPNWESVRQQWHRFNLDAFLPMLYQGFYNEEIDWIGNETQKALQRLNHSKPIYSGLFLPHLTSENINEAISSAYDGGAKGFSLFGDLSEEMKSSVKDIIKGGK